MAEGAVVRETVWRAGPDEALFIPEMWLRWAFSYDLACAGRGFMVSDRRVSGRLW